MKGSKSPAKKAKDLAPKSGSIKGGKAYTGNENITLVRGAKPTPKKKDLPGRKDVKGGVKKA